MSTFNGSKYLRSQLDSILNQAEVEVTLIVRDDGSSDCTLSILSEYERKYPQMHVIVDGERKGAAKSFLWLIEHYYDDEFFALADQDDVWDLDKLSIAVTQLMTQPKDTPALYYSNLRIVDKNNIYCRNSHIWRHVLPKKYGVISASMATGCTIVYNQKMAILLKDHCPENFEMHDIWLFMVATFLGVTIYDFAPHINYRQHDDNVIGASKKMVSLRKIRNELGLLKNRNTGHRYENMMEFYHVMKPLLSMEDKDKIEEFLNYKNSACGLIKVLLDNDYNADCLYRTLKFKLQLLLGNA